MNQPLRLYSFAPFDRAARVRWTALELGLPLEEVHLSYGGGEHKEDAFRAKNPFCQVPVAETGEQCLFQSVAICLHLTERHPQGGLAPAPEAPQRASWLSWLFFCASDLDAKGFQAFDAAVLRPDPERRAQALKAFAPTLQVLEQQLTKQDYLADERFSLPDILLGHALVLLTLSKALDDYPQLRAYRDRLSQRPAAQASGLFAVLQKAG